jgi:hypothetical protein
MGQNVVLDVDKFLEENAVTIKLHGKAFTIKDIDDEAQKLMAINDDDKEDGHTKLIVKSLLKCSDDDLKDYGSIAIAAIMREITENLLLQSSQKNQ